VVNTVTVNTAAALRERARQQPHTLALIQTVGMSADGPRSYRHFTYAELDAESDRLARGLLSIGVSRGARTVLMVPPSLEFYALTFALFKIGAVVVLIDPGMGVKNLGVCLNEAQPEAFIGVAKAHAARVLLRWGKDSLRTFVTVGSRIFWGGWTLAEVRRRGRTGEPVLTPTTADETAAILFTSGSTGVAKGVVYTHAIFGAQVELLRRIYGIEPGEVDLPTFPLFGLFGPALGFTSVLPEMDATRPAHVNPRKILDAVRHFGVTNLFGSPALLRRVGEYGSVPPSSLGEGDAGGSSLQPLPPNPPPLKREGGERALLPTLRRVISAGAPVPPAVIARFCTLLPEGTQVHTPYGATESLPVCTIGSDEILGETGRRTAEGAGVCVGRPVQGLTVRVIAITDEPIPLWNDALELPACAIGEVVVSGPVVTAAYHNRPASTELAKISDPQRATFWHRMGDVGYLDDRGRLWFCGRKSQRVTTAQGTLFTIPCEGVFNAHPAVRRTALVGVNEEPVLCVEREPGATIADEKLREELLKLGAVHAHTSAIRHILFHPAFPVDIRHNAKIFREKLAVWAARKLR
jgi:olefin beta-lactone synthetase